MTFRLLLRTLFIFLLFLSLAVPIFVWRSGSRAVIYQPAFDTLDVSPADWQARGATLEFNGNEIFYIDEGVGDVTLLLHGYPTSSWDYHKIWAELTESGRVISADFLGYGYSAKPSNYAYSIADHADMLTALLAHHDISQVKLVAHDIGLNVATELVARDVADTLPFELQSVVLMNGTLFNADRNPSPIQNLLAGPLGSIINAVSSESTYVTNLQAITTGNISDDEFAAAWYMLNYPASDRMFHRLLHSVDDRITNETRWADALCQSNIPLHLIIGAQDPTSGLQLRDALLNHCGDARPFQLTALNTVGHFPQLEAPQNVLKALEAWPGDSNGN